MGGIAGTSNGHCIERAISTMRLALGYEVGLPSDWQPGERKIPDLVVTLGQSFPNRKVLVWHNEDLSCINIPSNVKSHQVSHMGEIQWDDYLVAFVYGEQSGKHIVIGTPTQYGDDKWPTVLLVIAIELNSEVEAEPK